MSELARALLIQKPDWTGVGSVSIQPVYNGDEEHRRLGWQVSINGDYNNRVYAFADAADAVSAAILEYNGQWPPEVLDGTD